MTTMRRYTLERLCRFVRDHSPGEDAVVDETRNAVTWTQPDEDAPNVARSLAEARNLLGY